MKLSDYVIDFLVSQNIQYIFEVCGGAITHLLDSLYKRKDISTVSMHHEQAAAFAAEGYARASGHIGVAMATSGPGATNLITGIGNAFFDSTPCIFITGQVNTYEFKFNKPVRQIGFQETDIVKIIRPLVKEAILVTQPNKIRYYLEKAVFLAKSGRPGPVLLDIPMNIQRADINPNLLKSYREPKVVQYIDTRLIKNIIRTLKEAQRPVILAGGGVRVANACDVLLEFIRKTGIPVVTSLMGLDSIPHSGNYFVGMIGTYGNRYANLTIANADLVLALGTRFDTRQTGTNTKTFAREAKIIHVDIDPRELNNKIKVDFAVNADVEKFLTVLNRQIKKFNKAKLLSWKKRIKEYKDKYPSYKNPTKDNIIDPNFFIHTLSEYAPRGAIICVDIGQNQMWAAQSFKIKGSERFLTQGGMAAMGSVLSSAIGASFAKPGKIIVAITGDGGFQLNVQELQTLYHHQLPIKIILLNNHCYGMVRQFQKQYFAGRYQSTVIGYSEPDFQDLVSAYKIRATRIKHNRQIKRALKNIFHDTEPSFLEVDIKKGCMVLPKLAVNKPLEDQDPYLTDDEFKANMIIKPLRA
ncbi:MAG: acetolactate synthase [Omnitrophica WOR_2 bacterium RBG_13_41_10]|nr:MAG: acetolactate synthase [Omnitrophica WOR_2 bacterium RBG_13_41_10]